MNPAFKYNFGDIGSNAADKPGEQADISNPSQKNYAQAGYNRNVCFHWLDGRSLFLSYSYLISGEIAGDLSNILLEFTTHHLKLTGLHLQKLFDDLMHQIVMHVYTVDSRYNALHQGEQPVVNDIQVAKNE